MKKTYIQPEFDLLKLSSTEDILFNSLDEEAEASKIFNNNLQGDYNTTETDTPTQQPGGNDEWT